MFFLHHRLRLSPVLWKHHREHQVRRVGQQASDGTWDGAPDHGLQTQGYTVLNQFQVLVQIVVEGVLESTEGQATQQNLGQKKL